MIEALEGAGDEAADVGLGLTIDVIDGIRGIDGVSGVHLMGMGHGDVVARVVEGAGLFPGRSGSAGERVSVALPFLDRHVRPIARSDVVRDGRITLLSAYCSRTCAVQPAIRASAKIGVIRSVGMPSVWYTLAA